MAYAEDDLQSVRTGAARWVREWKELDVANLRFQGEVTACMRHDSGAVPAPISAYEFLYGN